MMLQVIDVMTFTLSIFMMLLFIGAFLQAIYFGISNRDKFLKSLVLCAILMLIVIDSSIQIALSTGIVNIIINGEATKNFTVFLALGTSFESLFYDIYIVDIKNQFSNTMEQKHRKKLITNWAIALIIVHLILFWYLWPLWKMLYQILL